MRITDALKWGLLERAIAAVSFALGAIIVLGALKIGAGNTLTDLLSGNVMGASGPQNVPVTLGGMALGLLVWQIGRTTARNHAVVAATEEQMSDELNTERLKSEVLSALDGRLSEMEADLEEVRRQAARIEQKERTGEFEFVHDDPELGGLNDGDQNDEEDALSGSIDSDPVGGGGTPGSKDDSGSGDVPGRSTDGATGSDGFETG